MKVHYLRVGGSVLVQFDLCSLFCAAQDACPSVRASRLLCLHLRTVIDGGKDGEKELKERQNLFIRYPPQFRVS